jgi:hypothetical protein
MLFEAAALFFFQNAQHIFAGLGVEFVLLIGRHD